MEAEREFFFEGDIKGKHTDWGCRQTNADGMFLNTPASKNNFIIFTPSTPTYFPKAGGDALEQLPVIHESNGTDPRIKLFTGTLADIQFEHARFVSERQYTRQNYLDIDYLITFIIRERNQRKAKEVKINKFGNPFTNLVKSQTNWKLTRTLYDRNKHIPNPAMFMDTGIKYSLEYKANAIANILEKQFSPNEDLNDRKFTDKLQFKLIITYSKEHMQNHRKLHFSNEIKLIKPGLHKL
ncbi:hypothetical protein PR048_011134 [Dryococelus australis]|uniref:Uncharacterized protein n=1 Tax=Dryococelus australis TaxID=614101 RepID=A0ABQ9HKQ4_9NEOP|nr:hypothetical protein PR048_011134 [Dryococelus australis]